MRKIFPLIILSLIIILSAILIFHMTTIENEPSNESSDQIDATVEISTEIDNLILEENSEIDIGEMI